MGTRLTKKAAATFESIKRVDENGVEYWLSRDLAKILEYADYRNFIAVINKAKEACSNSGNVVLDHFGDVTEMVTIGSGAQRPIDTIKLTRYACYLTVQNADPSKTIVAQAQTYFAIQTRIAEVQQMEEYNRLSTEEEKRLFLREEMAKHNSQLADAAKEAGVIEPYDYAVFQNYGYQGLYGGLGAKEIHARKGLKKSQKILDHMGSTELAANLFRATQTEEKLRRENIKGKMKANKTHYDVGKKVRQTIKELGGTMPEDLPVAESIKSVCFTIGRGEVFAEYKFLVRQIELLEKRGAQIGLRANPIDDFGRLNGAAGPDHGDAIASGIVDFKFRIARPVIGDENDKRIVPKRLRADKIQKLSQGIVRIMKRTLIAIEQ